MQPPHFLITLLLRAICYNDLTVIALKLDLFCNLIIQQAFLIDFIKDPAFLVFKVKQAGTKGGRIVDKSLVETKLRFQ